MTIPRWHGNLKKTWLPRIDGFYATLIVTDISIFGDVLESPDEISKHLEALVKSWAYQLSSRYLIHHAFIFFLSNSEVIKNKRVIKNKEKMNVLPDDFRCTFAEKAEEEDALLYIVRWLQEALRGDRKIGDRKIAIRALESSWTYEAVQGQLISAVRELRDAKDSINNECKES